MPSLLVFDDLHLLCPSASEGPENPADDMHAGVASWLCDVLASFRLPGRQPLPGEASTCSNAASMWWQAAPCLHDARQHAQSLQSNRVLLAEMAAAAARGVWCCCGDSCAICIVMPCCHANICAELSPRGPTCRTAWLCQSWLPRAAALPEGPT